MEVEYIQNQKKKNEKIFQLSNYKKQNKKKLEALQFSQKTTLSSRFWMLHQHQQLLRFNFYQNQIYVVHLTEDL